MALGGYGSGEVVKVRDTCRRVAVQMGEACLGDYVAVVSEWVNVSCSLVPGQRSATLAKLVLALAVLSRACLPSATIRGPPRSLRHSRQGSVNFTRA